MNNQINFCGYKVVRLRSGVRSNIVKILMANRGYVRLALLKDGSLASPVSELFRFAFPQFNYRHQRLAECINELTGGNDQTKKYLDDHAEHLDEENKKEAAKSIIEQAESLGIKFTKVQLRKINK